MRVFVLDSHPIFRQGLVACLAAMKEVVSVSDAGSVAEACAMPAFAEADVVVVDDTLMHAGEFLPMARQQTRAQFVVCSSRCDEDGVMEAVQAGAVGYFYRDTLTREILISGMRAAANGSGVMAPELLGALLRGISRLSRDVLEPRGLSLTRLTGREQEVLRLVADGHPTREVATTLCYSERTVKNVIHDATTKLNARSRSQAIALALREGLI